MGKHTGNVGSSDRDNMSSGPAESPYAKYCILVADDQESITSLVEAAVRSSLGCDVIVASNGDEVLARLKENAVDILVTDMRMPGVHGLELIAEVRRSYPNTDIIVVTGYPNEFPYIEVIEAGASDFLNKPFSQTELQAKLMRLLREHELNRERIIAESKYRSLFELNADGMLLLNGSGFQVVDANQAFCRLIGAERDEVLGKLVWDFFKTVDRIRMEQWLSICSRSGGGTMADLALLHPEEEDVYVDVSATFIQVELERIVFVTFKDVTEKREIETQLAAAAQRDELTGLYNKRSFQNRIQWAVQRAQRDQTALSLLMIDLDNFKHCNDTFGHQVGDQLLVSVGNVIARSVRISKTDEGFRCGGDEFMVILQESDGRAGMAVAKRMRGEFGKVETYGTTMSIGLAEYQNGAPAESLIRRADEALYKAKAMGKNAIQIA